MLTVTSNENDLNSGEEVLTFGFSTLAQRYEDIVLPEAKPFQEILIVVQNPTGLSINLHSEREDIRVVELKSLGVAKSRNVAISQARGRYMIFADDDVTFKKDGLIEALEYFEANPDCTLILGKTVDEHGHPRKRYPVKHERLTRYNSARAGTIEMMIRIEAIRSAGITFDENFGAGAENFLGDEYIFISDLVKKGLRADYLPIVLAEHPAISSGNVWETERDLKVRAQVFKRVFGKWAFFIRIALVIRQIPRGLSISRALFFIKG